MESEQLFLNDASLHLIIPDVSDHIQLPILYLIEIYAYRMPLRAYVSSQNLETTQSKCNHSYATYICKSNEMVEMVVRK